MLSPLKQLYHDPLLVDPSRLPYPKEQVINDIPKLFGLKARVMQELEAMRRRGMLGSSLEARVVLCTSGSSGSSGAGDENEGEKDPVAGLIKQYGMEALETLLIVSELSHETSAEVSRGNVVIKIRRPNGHKCARCWRYKAEYEDGLCKECGHNVKEIDTKKRRMSMPGVSR